jgi:hypothetical protein
MYGMCWPVSRQTRFSLIIFLQQEPEPEPEPRARIRFRFRFFLGQNDTVPAVPVPVPQNCLSVSLFWFYLLDGSGIIIISYLFYLQQKFGRRKWKKIRNTILTHIGLSLWQISYRWFSSRFINWYLAYLELWSWSLAFIKWYETGVLTQEGLPVWLKNNYSA